MKATITVDVREARVYTPYSPELLEIIKAIPGRKWNADRKYWTIPADLVATLARDLRAAGCEVIVDDLRKQAPRPKPTAAELDWAAILLSLLFEINPLLAERAYTSLTKVLHPDLGNDTGRLMQQLNDARAKLQKQRRAS